MLIEVKTLQQIKMVACLAKEIWMDHYPPIIGIEQTEYMLERFQSVYEIAHQVQSRSHVYFLIEHESKPSGYFAVHPRQEDLFVSGFYVKRPLHDNGRGRSAIHFTEQLACKMGKSTVTLTVHKHHSDSIAAYSRYGFVIVGATETDIGNGFVMKNYVLSKPCNGLG
jgi:diamine N-acetyltransferase